VRPVAGEERAGFDRALDEHHWLGHRLFGETMRYVATTEDGTWLALVGFGSGVFSCRPRDAFVAWSDEQRRRRLRYVVGNQRLCVLPAGRRPNLASAVLARTLRRLSSDYQTRWGHPALVVETFVDPSRHLGTCYQAAGFTRLGETLGYGKVNGRYVHHGKVKVCFARPLRRDALGILAAPFDHPLLVRTARRRPPVLDLNALALEGGGGLLERLERIADHRKRRGVRHRLASVLAIAACATLAGARSLAAIGEWAQDLPQEVLARLGAKYHPDQRRYIPPHDATIRRAIAGVDADALDQVIGEWLLDQVDAGRIEQRQLVLAVDGKSLRGARQDDGRPVHLFAAMVHGDRAVVAQREVDHKTNEITALRPLLEGLDLTGAVVTADAMHAQRDHAEFLVTDKQADYVLGVKANQPKLLEAIESMDRGSFPP
jgi:Domain of unknown function (DUF4338)/DDE_Tnp_1-associated/Transposase DDE domain